jgi:hypothetical protein
LRTELANGRAPSVHPKVKARKGKRGSLGECHQGALRVWGRRKDTAVARHNNDGDDNDNDDYDYDDDGDNNNNNNNSNLLRLHLQTYQCSFMSLMVCTSNDS